MEVILKKEVEHVGHADELVTVKNGFGRNYLIPKGLATLATPAAKKMHTETVKQRKFKYEKIKEEAQKTANKLKETTIKVGAKVGESGKIFGSVTNLQIADAIKTLGFEVERKRIKIVNEPIKTIGKYTATIKFHKDIVETVEFEVVEG